MKKLQEKHQSSQQQQQAAVALSLYYAIVRSDPEDNFIESANSREQSQPSRQQQHTASPVSCSWGQIFGYNIAKIGINGGE